MRRGPSRRGRDALRGARPRRGRAGTRGARPGRSARPRARPSGGRPRPTGRAVATRARHRMDFKRSPFGVDGPARIPARGREASGRPAGLRALARGRRGAAGSAGSGVGADRVWERGLVVAGIGRGAALTGHGSARPADAASTRSSWQITPGTATAAARSGVIVPRMRRRDRPPPDAAVGAGAAAALLHRRRTPPPGRPRI